MSILSGSLRPQARQQAAVSGLQLQSSAYGKVLPIVYGTTRIAPNLIWYGDFTATPQSTSTGGGKGAAGGGGGGKGGGGGTYYIYSTAVALGLCEGPINGVGTIYVNKSTTNASGLGFAVFGGEAGQAPWGYLSSQHPTEALGYSRVAYLAAQSYALGESAHMPNHTVEIYGAFSFGISGDIPDADPSYVIADILTNPIYGAGLPLERIGSLNNYQAYCLANGLWISVAFAEQDQATSMLESLATATHSEFVWSSGVLNLVPYGDTAVSGNGYDYTPPDSPLFDLTDDDFILESSDGDPIQLTRKRASDQINTLKAECLDRSNSYNPAIVEAKDQALIDSAGVRSAPSARRHMFADVNAARISAQLELQRHASRNIYRFTLDQRYVLLDPMDIVTISDAKLGITRQWVRITEITESEDGTLSFTAEDYLQSSGHASLYHQERANGYDLNANADPGAVNTPVVFEPTAALSPVLETWVGVSGGPFWGGCEIWLSYDAQSYRYAGRVNSGARTGQLSGLLPSVITSTTGQTVDVVNPLQVDLSESRGELLSASQVDVDALVTLCYADGELIAYRDATLTGTHTYDLQWLVRGAYGSKIAAHTEGAEFVRVDDSLLHIPFTADAIGTTIYFKCVSFNLYGAGLQTLADVEPFAYTLRGTALASPPADVTQFTTSYIGGITHLSWLEVSDFRSVQYEVRKGTDWNSAQVLGRIAHPPFILQGNGTYWVAALCQPTSGIRVYSAHPVSVVVGGAQIVNNVIASWDEAATSWSGTLSGSAVVAGGIVRTSGAGNILDDADYLTTISLFDYGFEGDGAYEIPESHIIDIGRVAACSVIIHWQSLAQHFDYDMLTLADYLNYQDVLDFAASANADVYPEIALSQDGTTFGSWQRYAPGYYNARAYKARMQLVSLKPTIVAMLQSFVFAVDVPDRDDHYVNLALPSGGSTISFKPDGSATSAPFNGGPQGSPTMPHVQVSILSAQDGDVVVISDVDLASCNVQVKNAGSGVARNVNLLVQGY